MDYTGIFPRFKVNRPLTEEEHTLRLHQSVRLDVPMIYQRAVIRMNSTYLETTDKFYPWVGWLTLGLSMLGLMCITFLLALNFGLPTHTSTKDANVLGLSVSMNEAVLFISLLVAPIVAVCIWGLLREAFRHTHYPIRFNRKTRKVHAFRYDGTIISASWDKLFFTLGRGNRRNFAQNWDIRAHVLAEDGITVLDTFSLGDYQEDQDLMRRFWEMHRRYMEDGPNAIKPLVRYFMPLENGKRESYFFGLQRVWVNLQPSFVAFWIMAPFIPFIAIARWFAMRTSKVPRWPAEIEAECRIEATDKFELDSRNNPTETWAMWR